MQGKLPDPSLDVVGEEEKPTDGCHEAGCTTLYNILSLFQISIQRILAGCDKYVLNYSVFNSMLVYSWTIDSMQQQEIM